VEKNGLQRAVLVLAGAVFLCLVCPVAAELSFSPVPVTAGTFAVLLVALLLGWRGGLISVALYLLAGALGLPVFAGWVGGLAHLTGPAGGYLFCYLVMVLIAGLLADRHPFRIWWFLLGCLCAAALELLLGNLWLSVALEMSYSRASVLGIIPFVLFDGIKLLAAWLVGYFLRTRVKVFYKPAH